MAAAPRAWARWSAADPRAAIFKSVDAGAKWTKITTGLPKGDIGRIALGVDPKAKPTRVYALINGLPGQGGAPSESGFYRSDDAGATLARMGVPFPAPPAPPAAVRPIRGRGAGAAARRRRRRRTRRRARRARIAAATRATTRRSTSIRSGPDTIWSGEHQPRLEPRRRQDVQRVPNMGGVHVDYHDVWIDKQDATTS